uniref:Uncharacterized protein n=1 Tax=Parascaris univalens TaxID=6257 RepID=A0A914ZIP4_PARUN
MSHSRVQRMQLRIDTERQRTSERLRQTTDEAASRAEKAAKERSVGAKQREGEEHFRLMNVHSQNSSNRSRAEADARNTSLDRRDRTTRADDRSALQRRRRESNDEREAEKRDRLNNAAPTEATAACAPIRLRLLYSGVALDTLEAIKEYLPA